MMDDQTLIRWAVLHNWIYDEEKREISKGNLIFKDDRPLSTQARVALAQDFQRHENPGWLTDRELFDWGIRNGCDSRGGNYFLPKGIEETCTNPNELSLSLKERLGELWEEYQREILASFSDYELRDWAVNNGWKILQDRDNWYLVDPFVKDRWIYYPSLSNLILSDGARGAIADHWLREKMPKANANDNAKLMLWALRNGWKLTESGKGIIGNNGFTYALRPDRTLLPSIAERILAQYESTLDNIQWREVSDKQLVDCAIMEGWKIQVEGNDKRYLLPPLDVECDRLPLSSDSDTLADADRKTLIQHLNLPMQVPKKRETYNEFDGEVKLVGYYFGLKREKAIEKYHLLKEQGVLADIVEKAKRGQTDPKVQKCPVCDGPMVLRTGSRGAFYGCQNYPHCSGTTTAETKVTKDKKKKSKELFEKAMTFVEEMGGAKIARDWILIVEQTMLATEED